MCETLATFLKYIKFACCKLFFSNTKGFFPVEGFSHFDSFFVNIETGKNSSANVAWEVGSQERLPGTSVHLSPFPGNRLTERRFLLTNVICYNSADV